MRRAWRGSRSSGLKRLRSLNKMRQSNDVEETLEKKNWQESGHSQCIFLLFLSSQAISLFRTETHEEEG
jgi:hypothetical protein